jgi:phosphatidylglycerophosphate synthase
MAPRQPTETRAVDYGILFRVYERTVFAWAVHLLPIRLRPNVITIVGQCCAVLGALAAAAAVAGRPYLYPVSALLLIGFLFADNLDGMHARRTGQVSRAGELLDHGLDGIASISSLLTVGLIMRVHGSFLVVLACLGTLAFVAAYWEQYRTGLLVCPRIGQSEGFTALAVMELCLLGFREPTWLRFSTTSLTAGTFLVAGALLGYVGSVLATVRRAVGGGAPPGELALVALASVACFGYALAGAEPWIVALLVGLFGADVVVRSLRLRRQGLLGRLVDWPHASLVLPLAGRLLPGQPLGPSTLAGLGATAAAAVYAGSILRGLRESRFPPVAEVG